MDQVGDEHMPLPPKAYFTLAEIETRWGMARPDTVYYVENGLLTVCLRTFGLWIESGIIEHGSDGQWQSLMEDRRCHKGLLPIDPREAAVIFRDGQTEISSFRMEPGFYCRVCKPSEPISLGFRDIVVCREERDRFETAHGLAPTRDHGDLIQRNEYSEIWLRGRHYRLGTCQAAVVRLLHDAARDGAPWVSGKRVLMEAGSRGNRLADLFKTQPGWRDLIISNRRGMYRLNVAVADTNDSSIA